LTQIEKYTTEADVQTNVKIFLKDVLNALSMDQICIGEDLEVNSQKPDLWFLQ